MKFHALPRVGVVALSAVGMWLSVGHLNTPPTASACSREVISAATIRGAVSKSQIVAIGEFIDSSERSATFRVDESLRGPSPGSKIKVDNRTSYTGIACSPYDEEFQEGFRFAKGDRKVLLLEKEVEGLWQVSFYSDSAWDVPTDDLQPMVSDFWDRQPSPPRIDAVRVEITRLAKTLGSDMGFESRTPCNPTQDLERRVASSSLVVIADIEGGTERQVIRVREVLAGQATSKELTVNFRVRRSYDNCELILEAPLPLEYSVGGPRMLFLQADEFGVADYRVSLWGSAMEQVNDLYMTEGLPTLREIRIAVSMQSPPTFVAEDADNDWWLYVLAIGLIAVVVAALAAWRIGLR